MTKERLFEMNNISSSSPHTTSTSTVNSTNAPTPTTTSKPENHLSSSNPPIVNYRRDYIAVNVRGSGHPANVKVKKKCLEMIFSPSVIFLSVTILLTGIASTLLALGLTGENWEIMVYNSDTVTDLVKNSHSRFNLTWFFNGKVPRITDLEADHPTHFIYLLPIHSGVLISCLDITEDEFEELKLMGYENMRCVDHLEENEENIRRSEGNRGSWQHRMQNLSISCGLVCLILLAANVLVGLFGLLRCQISAVLVTGVIYFLAATFSLFTLSVTLLKHKNRQEEELPNLWLRLTPEYNEFRSARTIYYGYSLQLVCAGSMTCFLASALWIFLSKSMRYMYTYNPFPIIT